MAPKRGKPSNKNGGQTVISTDVSSLSTQPVKKLKVQHHGWGNESQQINHQGSLQNVTNENSSVWGNWSGNNDQQQVAGFSGLSEQQNENCENQQTQMGLLGEQPQSQLHPSWGVQQNEGWQGQNSNFQSSGQSGWGNVPESNTGVGTDLLGDAGEQAYDPAWSKW